MDHELGDGSRRVKLACVTCRLEILEDLFVNVAEQVPVFAVVEVDLVDFVDDLTHQRAVLHVVVGIVERIANYGDSGVRADASEGLYVFEQVVVNEVEQLVTGQSLVVSRPVAPTVFLRQGRLEIVVHELLFGLAVVNDLQKEHPRKLLNALSVAVGAGVLPHDVLNGFDGGGYCHLASCFHGNVVVVRSR